MNAENTGVINQIAELERMDVKQLKDGWRELFGNEAPGYNKRFLVKRLAYKIQENAYGGLPKETLKKNRLSRRIKKCSKGPIFRAANCLKLRCKFGIHK